MYVKIDVYVFDLLDIFFKVVLEMLVDFLEVGSEIYFNFKLN